MSSPIDLTLLDDDEQEPCPVCTDLIPVSQLAAHCESHFSQPQASSLHAAPASVDDGVVLCSTCGASIALAELDSHLLAHELQGDQEQAEEADLDQLSTREAEELYFRELRAKYGFEDAERPGACYICGTPGHWARECPQNPHNRAAQARLVEPLPAAIVATQQEAGCTRVEGGIIPQLAACLQAQQNIPASVQYQAYLCGPVEHYQGEAFDGGWGCGYRNMQMGIAHLLATRQEAREALFGGCGFVPDIPALQAWLECAWRSGFDVQGAEQLGGRVQGTRKWVGTTEAATLLRYFGIRARIVDFGTQQQPPPPPPQQQQQQQQQGRSAAGQSSSGGNGGSNGSSLEVHPGVQCDGCGRCPIAGPRYRSQVLADFDLCGACHAGQREGPAAPFTRMMAGRVHLGAATQQQQQAQQQGGRPGGRLHDRLMEWVWDYFSSPAAQQPAASTVATATAGAAGADRPSQQPAQTAQGFGGEGPEPGPSRRQQEQQQEQQQRRQPGGESVARPGGQPGEVWVPDEAGAGGAGGGSEGAKRQRTATGEREGLGQAPGPWQQQQGSGSVQQQRGPGSGGAQQQRGPGGSGAHLRQQQLPWGGQGQASSGPIWSGRSAGPCQRGQGGQQAVAQRGQLSVVCTSRPPLYFQHEGHSRTIVGIERRLKQGAQGAVGMGEAEYTLLVLDPGCPTRPLADALQRRAGWQRMVKRGAHTLRKPQYQLLWCEPGLARGAEYEALKLIAAAERY